MDTEPPPPEVAFKSLADYVVKYDMSKLVAESRIEFEAVVASRELVNQDIISQMFNSDN